MTELIIEPIGRPGFYWRELWHYRELFYVLAWRDLLVRYQQTVIGIAWVWLRPLITMLLFTFVFNKVAKLEAPAGIAYPLLVLSATLPWQFFSGALNDASQSLIGNSQLITKVYFPRMIVPAGSVVTCFVDFLVTLTLLAVLMTWYGFLPDWRLAILPLFVALNAACALGAGLWLAAINVEYRDFRYVMPFILQLSLYASPIGFTSDLIPVGWRILYACNPLVGIIDGFRWSLLRGETVIWWPSVGLSVLITVIFCYLGIRRFRRVEDRFADLI